MRTAAVGVFALIVREFFLRCLLLAALCVVLPASLGLAQSPAAPTGDAPAPAAAPADDGASSPAEMLKKTQDQVAAMAARLAKGDGQDEEWLLLARSYISLGEFDKAKEAARHLIALHPKEIEPRLTLAEAQMSGAPHERGLPADFIATMREIHDIDPKNPGGLFYLGLAAAQADHPQEARKLWTTLLDTLPKDDPRRGDVVRRLDSLPKK